MAKDRLLALAIKGLEAEREMIDRELQELRERSGATTADKSTGNDGAVRMDTSGQVNRPALQSRSSTAVGNGRKSGSRLTPEGRKRLSEAAKRRWRANRKTGKTTL